jgi:hypothetical protein
VDKEDKFISGIHNYCDRWCERCTFTLRCRVFEEESKSREEEKDITNQAFWKKLENSFARAVEMLREMAEQRGIDIDEISREEYVGIKTKEREKVDAEDVAKLAKVYSLESRKPLDKKEIWLSLSSLDAESKDGMLEIIYWYQFFISAKLQRGLSGILDFDGNLDQNEINDLESDANGSVKIGLIAIRRSLMAWTNLLSDENSSHIQPMISLLREIKTITETKFPIAMEFIRPGFDEIESVM